MTLAISFYSVHFMEINLHSLQRGHMKQTSLFFLYFSSLHYNEGVDLNCRNTKSEDIELEIALIRFSHLWFCHFGISVFQRLLSELRISNTDHTKTENKSNEILVSVPWWLQNIFLHLRASSVVCLLFSILVFSHPPCRKSNNQVNGKIQKYAIILHFNLYYWLGL